ncbi:Acyltransferase 3 [Mesorhizobium metallidurans STM 2683]|uniref:Acyltransferase 3 n=1 Tax=Mesorhizobium metallidurans STM 2683 TaxID=1297569 RepID=M5EK76_9HYPH|nr:acyltransferase family protein [Mesorhizobium metallidurans]CCV04620.1 Acyltransferase 3 [Mesorhizobium metallidurans STM 2683]
MGIAYRREIDGLRAIAVIPVLLFHADVPYFSGGYVGVDVFFVVSGYLITSLIAAELTSGRFSLFEFYERRARRILPALLLVVLCCIPFAWLFMQPADFASFGKSVSATALFVSNFHFWRYSGYFDAFAGRLPLLHTWSLAIEEQFYLVFPIALLLIFRFGRKATVVSIALVGIASFLLGEWAWRNDPLANFYLAPTRAWELMAGALCAFAPEMTKRRYGSALAAMGLVMILVSVFYYDPATPFPSAYALLPVGGAVLIILFATKGTPTAILLSNPVPVGIGLISYSLYLWHQPLFAFAGILAPAELSGWAITGLLGLSFVLAALTWRFVERPFRAGGAGRLMPQGRLLAPATLSLILLAGIGTTIDRADGFDYWLSDQQREIMAFKAYERSGLYRERSCFLDLDQGAEEFSPDCAAGQSLIWGDSHAAALAPGLRAKLPGGLAQFTASRCPPLDANGDPRCAAINQAVMASLETGHYQRIFIHADWAAHRLDYKSAFQATIDAIRRISPDAPIYIIGGVPQWRPTLPDRMVGAGQDLQLGMTTRVDAGLLSWLRDSDRRVADAVDGIENTSFHSLLDLLCSGDLCISAAQHDGIKEPLSWDHAHLTKSGSILVAKRLMTSINGTPSASDHVPPAL